ncbi:MAG: hypothetical protein K1X79_07125 [Oligoflexia bacterium]|nr:hypothetical protein [Oligoflexia bacterium]
MKRYLFSILLIACMAWPILSEAAPSKSGTLAGLELVTQNLLSEARNFIHAYLSIAAGLSISPEQAANAKQKLEQKSDEILGLLEQAHQELNQAGTEESQASAKLIALVDLQMLRSALQNTQPNIFGQACLPGSNSTLCIGGSWQRRRETMRVVLASEAAFLQDLGGTVDGVGAMVRSIAADLSLAAAGDQQVLVFGSQYLLDKATLNLQGATVALNSVSAALDGYNVQGLQASLSFPCNQAGLVQSLSGQLSGLDGAAQSAGSFSEFVSGALVQAYEQYDGVGGTPGYLTLWNNCISAREQDRDSLLGQRDAALAASQLALALQLDSDLRIVDEELNRLNREREVLTLRRAVITRLEEAANWQYESGVDEVSWRAAVHAFSQDIVSILPAARRVLSAGIALNSAAMGEVAQLKQSPTSDFAKYAGFRAARVSSIAFDGFARVTAGVTSIADVLQLFFDMLVQASSETQVDQALWGTLFSQLGNSFSIEIAQLTTDLLALVLQTAADALVVRQLQTQFDEVQSKLFSFEDKKAQFETGRISFVQLLGAQKSNPLLLSLYGRFRAQLSLNGKTTKYVAGLNQTLAKKSSAYALGAPSKLKKLQCSKKYGLCSNAVVYNALQLRKKFKVLPELEIASTTLFGGARITQELALLIDLRKGLVEN